MSPDCNTTHCSYVYSSDVGYFVSVEAVGCVTRVTECQSTTSRKLCTCNHVHVHVPKTHMFKWQMHINGV